MSDEGPSAGGVIVGCFLLLMGLCLVFLGGGCTLMILGSLRVPHLGDLIFMLIPIGFLVGGLKMIQAGLRSLGG